MIRLVLYSIICFSATGGADSDAGEIEEGDPLEDKDAQAFTGGGNNIGPTVYSFCIIY